MTRVRIHIGLLGCLMAGLLLVACRPQATTPAPAPKEKPVTIAFALPSGYKVQYQALADTFEAQNPHIRVQLLSTEEILGQDQSAVVSIEPAQARKLRTAADTAIMAVHPEITRMGLVQDLGPLIEAHEAFHPEDFYPGTLKSLQWDSGIWGLPFGANFEVIYYDKEAFDAAGLTYPQPGWTWDEFLDKARVLTTQEGGETLRWGFVPILPTPYLLIRGRAGPLVDITTQPVTPLLDRPVVAEALAWLRDLILVHKVIPPPAEPEAMATRRAVRSLVTAGRVAMWSDTSSLWAKWTQKWNQKRNVGVAPFPTNESGESGTYVYLRTYAMSAGTTHPEESWRWLAFLTRQGRARLSTYSMPARRSVAEASGYWEELDPEIRNTLRYALQHSIPLVGPGLREVRSAVAEALMAMLDGQSPEQALAEAQTRAMAQIAQAYGQSVTPVPIVVVTPRVEEAKPGVEEVTFSEPTIIFVNSRATKQATYEKLAEDFHELHPDIRVEVREPDWDAIPEDYPCGDLFGVLRQGDCALMFITPPECVRDAALDLKPLLEGDPDFPMEDFYPQILEAASQEGKLWGLPLEAYPRGIYYNKALFDAAGLSYPTLDWTLEDFQALAMTLTQGEGPTKQYGYVPGSTGNLEPMFWIEQAGAQLIDDHVTPVRYPFAAPATVRAVQWYVNLVRTIGMPDLLETIIAPQKEFREVQAEAWSLVDTGRAAMWSEYLGFNVPLTRTYGFEVGLAPMPQGPGNVSDLNLLGLVISAQATPSAAQACWKWFTSLSAQPTAVEALPARHSVLESTVYRQHVGLELASLYAAIAQHLGRPVVSLRGLPSFLFINAYKAIKEGEDPVLALGEAERKAEVYARCLAMAGREDQETISKCAQEALRVSE